MKFYEFDKHKYYGLVLAESEEKAKLGYREYIADICESEEDLNPRIITLEEALSIYIKSYIDGCETDEERRISFYDNIKYFEEYMRDGSEQYVVLLIDGNVV